MDLPQLERQSLAPKTTAHLSHFRLPGNINTPPHTHTEKYILLRQPNIEDITFKAV